MMLLKRWRLVKLQTMQKCQKLTLKKFIEEKKIISQKIKKVEQKQ